MIEFKLLLVQLGLFLLPVICLLLLPVPARDITAQFFTVLCDNFIPRGRQPTEQS